MRSYTLRRGCRRSSRHLLRNELGGGVPARIHPRGARSGSDGRCAPFAVVTASHGREPRTRAYDSVITWFRSPGFGNNDTALMSRRYRCSAHATQVCPCPWPFEGVEVYSVPSPSSGRGRSYSVGRLGKNSSAAPSICCRTKAAGCDGLLGPSSVRHENQTAMQSPGVQAAMEGRGCVREQRKAASGGMNTKGMGTANSAEQGPDEADSWCSG